MKIVVISPTYNERINIMKLIPLLEEKIFPKIKNHQMSLLIVDDNSPDGTALAVKEFMKKWKNIFLLQGQKQGLGAAYVRGMQYAMGELAADAVIEFDSDFQHDPQDISRLIVAMDGGADHVIGSRYIPGGKIPQEWGMDRKLKSIFGSLFARIVLGTFSIHDMTSGYKLTRVNFLKRVDLDHLYSKYYAYKIQILYEIILLEAKIKEIPIIFYERREGSSKLESRDLYESFWVVLRLRLRKSQRIIKFLIIGGMGFVMQIITQETLARSGAAVVVANLLKIILLPIFTITDTVVLSDALATMGGAEVSIISNFLWNHSWTFRDTKHIKESASFFRKLIKFNTTSLGSIAIQSLAVWLTEKMVGTSIFIGNYIFPTRIVVLFPTIIFLIIPLNYMIYNKVIWKTQYLNNGKNSQK